MSSRKRTHDAISEAPSAATSWFQLLPYELCVYVATYCGIESLPALVAAGIVEFSENSTGKRCIAYDAVLVDAFQYCTVLSSSSLCHILQTVALCSDVVPDIITRRAMCALLIEARRYSFVENGELASLFYNAIYANNVELVRVLAPLENVMDNMDAKNGCPMLVCAVKLDRDECVRVLIDSGVDLEKPTSLGNYALHVATMYNCKTIVTMLLDAGANINCVNKGSGSTPLQIACFNNKLYDIAKLLLQRGANVNARSPANPHTPLCIAIARGLAPRTINLLLLHNADIHSYYGKTFDSVSSPLWDAMRTDNIEVTRLLLQLGASAYDLVHISRLQPDLVCNAIHSLLFDGTMAYFNPEHAALLRSACALYTK